MMPLTKSLPVAAIDWPRSTATNISVSCAWNARPNFVVFRRPIIGVGCVQQTVGVVPMDREDDRIMEELLRNAGARLDGYVEEWLANPEFRAILHRRDCDEAENDNSEARRVAR